MSAPVTESDTFPSAVVAPSVNDTNYPTIIPQMATQLANRTKYLRTTLMTGGASSFGADTLLANATASELTDITLPAIGRADLFRNALTGLAQTTRWLRDRVLGAGAAATTIRWVPAILGFPSASWTLTANGSGSSGHRVLQSTASSFPISLAIPHVQPGLIISNIRLKVSSPASHAGLPAVMPRLSLFNTDASTGFASEMVGANDASASTAAFQAVHDIVISTSLAVSSAYTLSLSVRGEDSTNAQDNSFRIFSASMDVWYV
jgi:hypothetical protein